MFICQITRDGELLTNDSHRLLNAKLEQKEYAKAYLTSQYVDPVYREHAKYQCQLILRKLEELQRVENVQRIRVMALVIIIYYFLKDVCFYFVVFFTISVVNKHLCTLKSAHFIIADAVILSVFLHLIIKIINNKYNAYVVCLMKEETGHRRREITSPIFDPMRSSAVPSIVTHRSFHSLSGYSGDDVSCHKDGKSNNRKSAKAFSSLKKVSSNCFVSDTIIFVPKVRVGSALHLVLYSDLHLTYVAKIIY